MIFIFILCFWYSKYLMTCLVIFVLYFQDLMMISRNQVYTIVYVRTIFPWQIDLMNSQFDICILLLVRFKVYIIS